MTFGTTVTRSFSSWTSAPFSNLGLRLRPVSDMLPFFLQDFPRRSGRRRLTSFASIQLRPLISSAIFCALRERASGQPASMSANQVPPRSPPTSVSCTSCTSRKSLARKPTPTSTEAAAETSVPPVATQLRGNPKRRSLLACPDRCVHRPSPETRSHLWRRGWNQN